MIIGIDIDDTISDTYEVLMNYAQEYTVNVLKREPILREGTCTNHYYVQFFHGWTEEESNNFFTQGDTYKKIIQSVRPKTFAVKYLKKLKDEGHKIVLITARWDLEGIDVKKITEDWLIENDIPFDKLIVNADTKLHACQQENVDLFIDDSFQNCSDIANSGVKTFLMNSIGNSGCNPDNFERVYSWPHVYMKISEKG